MSEIGHSDPLSLSLCFLVSNPITKPNLFYSGLYSSAAHKKVFVFQGVTFLPQKQVPFLLGFYYLLCFALSYSLTLRFAFEVNLVEF